jgi:hypothetical protein
VVRVKKTKKKQNEIKNKSAAMLANAEVPPLIQVGVPLFEAL